MLNAAQLFHAGIVVRDLEAAIFELTGVGHAFIPIFEAERQVTMGAAEVRVDFRVTFSTAPFHLELIQAREGTIWTASGQGQIHHFGYWSDDVAGDSARLTAAGMPLAARCLNWAYHDTGLGYYVELLDSAGRDAFHDRFN